MKLFQHADFEQAIIQAAEHFRMQGLRPAIIEKDYYVTESLRAIAAATNPTARADSGVIIFKGGTSLSKGWNLIQRFSEDIDIFLDPLAFELPLGKRAIDRQLKRLRDAVAEHPALTFVQGESQAIGGFGRNDLCLSQIASAAEGRRRTPATNKCSGHVSPAAIEKSTRLGAVDHRLPSGYKGAGAQDQAVSMLSFSAIGTRQPRVRQHHVRHVYS